jgi:hypothetical protein
MAPHAISVVTPSVRPEGLKVVEECLRRQTTQDFEWVVVMPRKKHQDVHVKPDLLLADPPKKDSDFYTLCKGWNLAFSKCSGDLVVSIQDQIWFAPDALERLLSHYKNNSKALVACIGHQYGRIEDNKPQGLVWEDPRVRTNLGTFYETMPSEMEMTFCSIPKQALIDCGGIDEEYDKGAAVGEKEMCWRLDKLGYKFYLDQSIEYRALHHPRLQGNKWDEAYKISSEIFIRHMQELMNGTRTLNVNCLNV